jgi:hypothetical protein
VASRKNERWFGERSEEEFRGELHRARITNGSDLAEARARDIRAGKGSKVRVVENIVGFSLQLERKAFAEFHSPRKREIEASR